LAPVTETLEEMAICRDAGYNRLLEIAAAEPGLRYGMPAPA
jgi:hypothetical protein